MLRMKLPVEMKTPPLRMAALTLMFTLCLYHRFAASAMVLVHVPETLLGGQNENNDADTEGLPVFLQQPDPDAYIVKGKPVTVTCKARFAVQINFKCAGQWIRPERYTIITHEDPATKETYLQTSVDVTKNQVEEYFESNSYWCECTAWNNLLGPDGSQIRKHVKSTRGNIHLACE